MQPAVGSSSFYPAATPPRPPPLTREPEERLLGLAVLDEFADEQPPLAHLLWTSLCNVRLWGESNAAERSSLFLPPAFHARRVELSDAGVDTEIELPLRVLIRLLRVPASIRVARVGWACWAIGRWAQELDKTGTALEFFQAAALADPADAEAAYLTGRMARGRAQYARAESWFDEALSRSREQRDWRTYALTYVGIGNLHLQRGNLPRAWQAHSHARSSARRHGIRSVEAMACHDLFAIAQLSERIEEANGLAADAFRCYGTGHPRLPNLAHDIGCFWAEQGQFGQARAVLEAVLPHMGSPLDRLLVFGNLARCCGAVGAEDAFQAAQRGAWAAVARNPGGEFTAMALLGVADGARSLGAWSDAETAAARAHEVAVERKEARAQFIIEALQASIKTGRRARAAAGAVDSSNDPEPFDALTQQLIDALAEWEAVSG